MDEINEAYPEYQATYMKGEVNFCVRKSDPKEAVDGMKAMIKEWESWVGSRGSTGGQKPTGTDKGEIVGKCPDCDSPVVFRSGTSKSGKPYQGNFCSKCDYVAWL